MFCRNLTLRNNIFQIKEQFINFKVPQNTQNFMKFINVNNFLAKLLFLEGIDFFHNFGTIRNPFSEVKVPSFRIAFIRKQNSMHFFRRIRTANGTSMCKSFKNFTTKFSSKSKYFNAWWSTVMLNNDGEQVKPNITDVKPLPIQNTSDQRP